MENLIVPEFSILRLTFHPEEFFTLLNHHKDKYLRC